MLNEQTAFNKVWRHFVVNKGKQSISATKGHCAYRGDAGARCAIGVLVPNRIYDKKAEGSTIDFCLNLLPSWKKHFKNVNPHFLRELQYAHDYKSGYARTPFSSTIKQRLKDVAIAWNLTIPRKGRA